MTSRRKVTPLNQQKNKAVAARMKQIARDKFGSQAGLARALGVVPQALTQYFNGTNLPGNAIQGKLRKLGVDVEFLMTGRLPKRDAVKFRLVVDPRAEEEIAALLQNPLS
jgi:hypothetical protein